MYSVSSIDDIDSKPVVSLTRHIYAPMAGRETASKAVDDHSMFREPIRRVITETIENIYFISQYKILKTNQKIK